MPLFETEVILPQVTNLVGCGFACSTATFLLWVFVIQTTILNMGSDLLLKSSLPDHFILPVFFGILSFLSMGCLYHKGLVLPACRRAALLRSIGAGALHHRCALSFLTDHPLGEKWWHGSRM